MPYIHIRVSREISDAQINTIQTETTNAMAQIMGKKRELTVVQIESSPADKWSLNGIPQSQSDPVCAYVEIKITAGTNSDEEKADMIQFMVDSLQNTLDSLQEVTYVVIHEIPGVSWGYGGVSQAHRATL